MRWKFSCPILNAKMKKLANHNQAMASFFDSLLSSSDRSELGNYTDLDKAETFLRNFLSVEEMREIGSFFTGSILAADAIKLYQSGISDDSIILDPTCGTGNLLIEASRNLKINKSLSETLKIWGSRLRGFDLQETFVEASKLRLILEAVSRGAQQDCSLSEALLYFKGITVRNALDVNSDELLDVTHLLMNPPFSSWIQEKSEHWGKGNINAAAIIFDHYIRFLPIGCNLTAILPDVLRSGSRYKKWRSYVSSQVSGQISLYGRFNAKTDVDVFVISGLIEKFKSAELQWFPIDAGVPNIADNFIVCIGPVVDYRDKHIGTYAPFIHPRNTPPWIIKSEFNDFRNFGGRLIPSPFVVIRRTSSPGDKSRIIAAVVDSVVPVAVENHFIVAIPKDGKLESCQDLLVILRSDRTQIYVDQRIRCRHLTVGTIKTIPID